VASLYFAQTLFNAAQQAGPGTKPFLGVQNPCMDLPIFWEILFPHWQGHPRIFYFTYRCCCSLSMFLLNCDYLKRPPFFFPIQPFATHPFLFFFLVPGRCLDFALHFHVSTSSFSCEDKTWMLFNSSPFWADLPSSGVFSREAWPVFLFELSSDSRLM